MWRPPLTFRSLWNRFLDVVGSAASAHAAMSRGFSRTAVAGGRARIDLSKDPRVPRSDAGREETSENGHHHRPIRDRPNGRNST